MAAAVGLRSDFDGGELRRLARASGDAKQVRRLLALAVIYEGGSRSEAARVGGVGLQIVRDWVLRFNANGPDGLIDGKAPGGRALLGEEQRRALAQMVENGPVPAAHGVVPLRQAQEAPDRLGAMGLGRVRHLDQQADAEPGASRSGLPEAVGPAAPSRPRPRRHSRF